MTHEFNNTEIMAIEINQSPTKRSFFLNSLLKKKRSKQKGFALIDLILWGVGILTVISIIVAMYPKVIHQINLTRLDSDLTEIQKAARSWKGMRTNYSSISMSDLCDDNYLADSICSADGANANPWGGDYTVEVDSSNVSRISVEVTDIDSNYANQVDDHVAPRTADECTSADSCSTAGSGVYIFN